MEPASYPRTMVRDDKTMMFKHGEQNDSQFNEREKTKFKFKHKKLFFISERQGTGTGDKVIK